MIGFLSFRLIALPSPGLSFLKSCIAIEAGLVGDGNAEALKQLRKLFNIAVEHYGRYDDGLWLEYCAQERRVSFLYLVNRQSFYYSLNWLILILAVTTLRLGTLKRRVTFTGGRRRLWSIRLIFSRSTNCFDSVGDSPFLTIFFSSKEMSGEQC